MNKPKTKKASTASKPIIIRGYYNFSKIQLYALIGVITEALSEREKERNEKLKKDPHLKKVEKYDDTKIVHDIYDKIGKIYPDSTFNVVVLNLVGGEFQFAFSKEKDTSYLSVSTGNRFFMIFKYKN